MIRTLTLAIALLATATTGSAFANTGVLVFGGTGQLGSEIVKDLLDAGEEVTVFARPSSKGEMLDGLNVSYVRGDVLNETDVEAALKSGPYRVVIDGLARDGGVGPDFYVDSMKYMAKWAAETGVKQFILHGSVGAGLSRVIYPEDRWDFMGATITAKDYGERHLMESGVPYTIIRNLNLLPIEVPESGKAYLTEDQLQGGPVTRDGLARLNMECMDNPDCIDEIFHGIDPDVVDPRRRD